MFRASSWNLLICCLLLLSMGGCSKKGSRIAEGEEFEAERTTFSFNQQEGAYDRMSRYLIQPGDVLDVLYQVQTWTKRKDFVLSVEHTIGVHFVHTPELDREQGILPDGNIVLPYLGKYYVVGKTVDQITEELSEKYQSVLRDPDIYIAVPEFRRAINELKADLHTAPRGLSRLVTVRPDGYVTFPMLGEKLVAERTITEVNSELNEEYDALISGLHVDLFLEKHSGSLVYILGEVVKPGSYQIIKPITVTQAIARAASFRPSARMERVVVVRKHEGKMVAKLLNLKESAVLGGKGGLFYLQPDDIVYVPQKRLSRWADIVTDVNRILMFRGWGVSLSYRLDDKDEEFREEDDEDEDN